MSTPDHLVTTGYAPCCNGVSLGRIVCTQCIDAIWSVATDVTRSVLGTRVSCAKTTEPIEMPFMVLTHVGSINHVLDGSTSPYKRGHLRGECAGPGQLFMTYLRVNALRACRHGRMCLSMHSPPRGRGDKTTMRPLAKLLWTRADCDGRPLINRHLHVYIETR